MTDTEDSFDEDAPEPSPAPQGIGPQLRAAREVRGLSLAQLASETRISRPHLEHMEAGEFGKLPGRTYAIGFARTVAKTIGLDQEDVVSMVRAEIDAAEQEAAAASGGGRGKFEPGDPSRSPGGGLLWFSLIAVAILLVGIFFAARALFQPTAELPSLVEQQQAEEAEAAAATAAARQEQAAAAPEIDTSGEVVFTAEGETWVRFYDGNGRVLQEGTMTEGDTFTLPADAVDPQIITGRPDRLAITIGGQPVAKLSTELETIQDVPISAEALLSRTGVAQTIGFALGSRVVPATQPTTNEPVNPASVPARPQPAATQTSAPPAPARPAASPSPQPTPRPTATPTRPPTPAPQPTPTQQPDQAPVSDTPEPAPTPPAQTPTASDAASSGEESDGQL
ncbi:helix-turn-helix domain-containing protein [Aurantiacibacter gangjinensis]|uniref:helix-turn-helix domain-containing protein n=1 Tax=Aurantiacibacter gangjinensis TaxID=502682 RepID=UPI0006995333|nr:helix-turn-helix domain-containing protein [Aurantiacibacter gangjinensis]APE29385.1 Rhs element Vgr protein [Aurantiacibacter gangjinensis]